MTARGSPGLLRVSIEGAVAQVRLDRPDKRNALSDDLIEAISQAFGDLPGSVKAVVLSGEGAHFSAGLDLNELRDRSAAEGLFHSRTWHAAFARIAQAPVPVIAALSGAVIGGGFELAASAHLRVADETAYFALPEGQRGLFVGGGGSVRIAALMGVPRMTDLMLTGRVLDAGEAERIGLVNYRVAAGQALPRALELAERIAQNAPMSNYAVLHALPAIANAPGEAGFLMESLIAAVAQSEPEAKERMRAFVSKRAGKVKRS